MATLYADGYDSNIDNQAASDSGTGCEVCKPFEYNFGTTAATTGDLLKLVPIPLGAIVTELYIETSDLDDGGTLVITLGDGTAANSYDTSVLQALARGGGGYILFHAGYLIESGTITTTQANTVLPKRYSAADSIDLTITTGGNDVTADRMISGYVKYTLQSSNSQKTGHVYGGLR